GQFDDLVVAVFEHEQDLVELRAFGIELITRNLVADVAGFAIVSDLESFERDFFGVHFVVTAGFGQAWIQWAVLGEKAFQMSDDVFGEVLEIFARFAEFAFGFLDLLAMLVDVEKGDSANADLEQAIDIGVADFAKQFLTERFKTVIYGRDDGL